MNEFETDELRLLRQTRGATTELSDESLVVGRARLEREIRDRAEGGEPRRRRATAAQARRPGRRTRGALWVGASVVAVGALVGTVIVATPAPILGPIPVEDPHAEAVELLERAADRAQVEIEDLQHGQFLRAASRSEGISSQWDPRTMDEGVPTALIRGISHETWYYPADSGVPKTSRLSHESDTLIMFPTGDSEEDILMRESISKDLEIIANDPEAPEFFETLWDPADWPEQETPPSDPQALRAYILNLEPAHTPDQPVPSNENRVLSLVMSYVTNRSLPGEVRAAAFRLLSEEPGATVSAFPGYDVSDRTDIRESSISIRPGTVIAFPLQLAGIVEEQTQYSMELIFDDNTAQLLGTRTILAAPSKEFPGIPVGSVVGASSFTTSIVDEIPEVETWK